MKKITTSVALIFAFCIFCNKAQAICHTNSSQMSKIVEKVCSSCAFPITIGGKKVSSHGSMPETDFGVTSPECICPGPPPMVERPGITVGYYDPSILIDVVTTPYCFLGMGFKFKVDAKMIGNIGTEQAAGDGGIDFFQSHQYVFPIFAMLGLLEDLSCEKAPDPAVGYITEVDPLWQDDGLAGIISPEALLFGNPATNLACMADAVSSQVGKPIDKLFWCKGAWGNAYPLTGNTGAKDFVEDSASIAASIIYKLHRQLGLWQSWGKAALCEPIPAPIWTKSAYRLQIMAPISSPKGIGIGKTGLLWSFNKNIPGIGDNFSYLVFKKKDCCAF